MTSLLFCDIFNNKIHNLRSLNNKCKCYIQIVNSSMMVLSPETPEALEDNFSI